ncbi:hypothetical protein [Methanobrevibacter sp.]
MNTVCIDDIKPGVKLVSTDDLATFLNLFYHDLVDDLLEYLTIFTDDEMIQEITNILKLNITMVFQSTNHGRIILGYITQSRGESL